MRKRRGIYERNGILYVRFQDENGKIVRESTGQSRLKLAEDILRARKTEVVKRIYFPTRRFESIRWSTLLDKWWRDHGQHTRSGFVYLLPRLRDRFGTLRARDITSVRVRSFLADLQEQELSASSINHYRTIINSVFNFAIKEKLYDENPVKAVHQFREPAGRGRFVSPEEVQRLLIRCDEIGDIELKVFILIAATTGMRKGEILPRRYGDLDLSSPFPSIYVERTKNGKEKRVALAELVVQAIKTLPSFGKEEYLFPARANIRFWSDFKKPHAWDIGKRFRRVCALEEIRDMRVHDLRHFAATTLVMRNIPDDTIRILTGHTSRELRRYQHVSPDRKNQTVELIASTLREDGDSATDTPRKSRRASSSKSLLMAEPTGLEPATSDVTGRRSNQLNYDSAFSNLRFRDLRTQTGGRGGTRTPNLFLVREAVYH